MAVQHGSPLPPQATHVPPLQVLKGAVHPTPPAQQAPPSPPHDGPVVGTQAPAVHVPSPLPHMPAAATQVPVLWSQQPPALQMLPSQHALPVPPQGTQPVFWASHARFAAVQNLPTLPPAPLGLPGQHPTPAVPHGFVLPTPMPPVHEEAGETPPILQVPRTVVPQDVPGAMHVPSTQQSPAAVQLLAWQHALFVVPQATEAPLSQT